jgi:hypothetical protein
VVSVTPRPRFTPGEKTPGTHCTGGWVGPRAGLDTEDRRKILCPRRGSNPDRPVVQPVVRHYTAWATPAPIEKLRAEWIRQKCVTMQLPFRLLCTHGILKINTTVILRVVLYGCETWSLALSEEHDWGCLIGLEGMEWRVVTVNCSTVSALYQILLRWSIKGGWTGHVAHMDREEIPTKFCLDSLRVGTTRKKTA